MVSAKPELGWTRMFTGLIFKVATDSECNEILERRSRIYEDELGASGIDEFDATATHLVALDNKGQMVSALRLITERPLEMERYVDLAGITNSDGPVAQIGGFWVERQWRTVRQETFLQIGMLKLAFMFGCSQGIREFVMYTYRRLTTLYRAAYFQALDVRFEHPQWGEVEVMRLDVTQLRTSCKRSKTPFGDLLLAHGIENFRI